MAILSGAAQNFFSQFQPYEQGGITGQMNGDSAQFQQQPDSGGMLPSPGFVPPPKMDVSNVPMAPDWQSRIIDPNAPSAPPMATLERGNSAFGQAGGNGINAPSKSAMLSGMGNLASLGSAGGGMLGIGRGNNMGAFTTVANKLMQSRGGGVAIMTPSGRRLIVPQEHLQEALRRGAQQV